MTIDYVHCEAEHSVAGPRTILSTLFANPKPSSLLDVGCGTGTWLKACIEFGIADVMGIEGVTLPLEKLHVPAEKIEHYDLTRPWNLGRRFDAVVCVEVAGHLDNTSGPILIGALFKHSDLILFSAACPGQPGQHHVNCQWPAYWQALFNEHGFVCEDTVRWKIWDNTSIEPWYRQNLFLARQSPASAGKEPRIRSVLHPALWKFEITVLSKPFHEHVHSIEQGRMPIVWYLTLPAQAFVAKLKRRFNLHA